MTSSIRDSWIGDVRDELQRLSDSVTKPLSSPTSHSPKRKSFQDRLHPHIGGWRRVPSPVLGAPLSPSGPSAGYPDVSPLSNSSPWAAVPQAHLTPIPGPNEPFLSPNPDFSPIIEESELAKEPDPRLTELRFKAVPILPDSRTFWNPFFFRGVLGIFFAVFALLIALLEILDFFSRRNHGLTVAHDNLHYLWTFGPTAVFVILAGFWGQVEFRTKQLMPWRAMANGPTSASKSVLLDYVSLGSGKALYKSFKNSHFVVALSIIGSFAIKILIIFSAGLLMAKNIIITRTDSSLILNERFDGAAFSGSAISTQPVYYVYSASALGLTLPTGTNSLYAWQSFNTSKYANPDGLTLEGTVEVFHANYECEKAGLDIDFSGREQRMNFSSDRCNVSLAENLSVAFGGDYYWGLVYNSTCSNIEPNEEARRRIFLFMHTQDGSSSRIRETGFAFDYAALMCKPRYSIANASVVLGFQGATEASDIKFPNNTSSDYTLPEVSPWDLDERIMNSVGAACHGGEPRADNLQAMYQGTMMFELLRLALPRPSNSSSAFPIDTYSRCELFNSSEALEQTLATSAWLLETLQDSTSFETGLNSVYASVAAQVSKNSLLIPSGKTVEGVVTFPERRLVVQPPSLRVLEAFLGLLIMITIALMFGSTSSGVSRDPGTISGLATILARSPAFVGSMVGTGSSTLKTLERSLSGYLYSTRPPSDSTDGTFSIRTDAPRPTENPQHYEPDVYDWWQPFALGIVGRVLAITLPILFIILLGVLFWYSDTHEGIANVTRESSRYAYVYLPAIVFIALSTLFFSLDLSTRVVYPYHILRNGDVPASQNPSDSHLGKVAISALSSSIQKVQPAVITSTVASLLASLSIIVASGLYDVKTFTNSTSITLSPVDAFDNSLDYTSVDLSQNLDLLEAISNATRSVFLLESTNLSFPQGTFEELAIPGVQSVSSNVHSFQGSSLLNVVIPGAVRASANCTVAEVGAFDLQGYPCTNTRCRHGPARWSHQPTINVSLAEYPSCRLFLEAEHRADTKTIYANGVPLVWPNATYPRSASEAGYWAGWTTFRRGDDHPGTPIWDHCPNHIAILAHMWTDEKPTVLYCTPYMQKLSVNATFRLPEYTIDPENPPIPIESNVTVLNNDTNINGLLDDGTTDSSFNYAFPSYNTTYPYLSPFFANIVLGREGTPFDNIAGPSNVEKFIEGIEHTHRLRMAQIYNYVHRRSLSQSSSSDSSTSLPGVILAQPYQRLIQSRVCTGLLITTLALILFSAIAACVTIDTVALLPKNPTSIAGCASLLAGSELLRGGYIPPGAEWCGDEELQRKGVYEGHGWRLGLKWWRTSDGGRRFGVDIGREEKVG